MTEIKGKIIVIGKTQTIGAKDFLKREIVIETEEKYPQKIKVDFTQGACDLLDKVNVGEIATISVNIRGTEYQGKYYVNLVGWKITTDENKVKEVQNEVVGHDASKGSDPMDLASDDLPF